MKRPDYTIHRAARSMRKAKEEAARAPHLQLKYTIQERNKFLIQSNAIERVYDKQSLADAIAAWTSIVKNKTTLTEADILQAHKLLMLHQRIAGYQRGYYRDCDVFVGMDKMLPSHLISTFMRGWLERLNACEEDWKKLHVEFEKIHPFVDGNGRIGRMLMNWHRLRLDLPLLIIREGHEQREYYKWFK